MTSAETAARFRSRYEARGAHLPEMIRRAWWRAGQFREVVLESISAYTPRGTVSIYRDVIDNWGDVGMRRFYRAIARLVSDGAIVRTPDGYVKARK